MSEGFPARLSRRCCERHRKGSSVPDARRRPWWSERRLRVFPAQAGGHDMHPTLEDAPAPDVNTSESHQWLTAGDIAERLNVRVGHLRALVSRREIPFGRVG